MNQAIIDEWNSKIEDGDDVIVLGDLFFCNMTKAIAILEQLKGNIHIVWGNHDEVMRISKKQIKWGYRPVKKEFEKLISSHQDYLEMTYKGKHLVMSHYPFLSWHQQGRESIHFHGHCHGSLPVDETKLRHDIGYDMEFKINKLDDVIDMIDERLLQIKQNNDCLTVDHH